MTSGALPPFANAGHDLAPADDGGHLALLPFPVDVAGALGAEFAAMEPWSVYPYPAAALAAYLATVEPGAPRFAVTLDGRIIGAAGLRLNWLRGPYLQFLGVAPPFQGLGIGAAVLAWLESEARRSGARNLWVAVSDFNGAAQRFYARAGFAEAARLDGLVADGRTEILMRKRLA